jgi:protein-S-isoprenylcysteine O-methyltransferase Ste14
MPSAPKPVRGVLLPALASFIFFFLAPGTIAGYLPWLITDWRVEVAFLGWTWLRGVGWVLLAGGLALVIECFTRFALQGRGTPAPVYPTERLVVTGLYRHVRNPMYVGVTTCIVGQALVLGSRHLVAYAALVWLIFAAWVLAYEQPTLRKRYGAQYDEYCRNVPAWWPRLRPWRTQPPA